MPVINDAVVNNNPFLTSSNARPQKLSNEWMVTTAASQKTDAITTVRIMVDTQMDGTPNFETFVNIGTDNQRVPVWSTASYGINFYLAYSFTTSTTVWVNHYQVSGSNSIVLKNTYTVDSGQSGFQSVDLIVNQSTGEISIGESTKNSTYPNSFNIRYAKGTINADGSVVWGAVEQVTSDNFGSGYPNFASKPSIGFLGQTPYIIIEQEDRVFSTSGLSNGKQITMLKRDQSLMTSGYSGVLSTFWSAMSIYRNNDYTQSSPSSIFVPQRINGLANGLIATAWHGKDSTHATTNYIRFSKATDGTGATWSAMNKLVPGTNATLTANKSGKLFITYEDAGVTKRIESTDNGDNWSTATTVGAGTNPSSLFDLTMDMSAPLTIRKGASSVLFTGSWTVTTNSVPSGDIGQKTSKDNLLTYTVTTDGAMSTITEKVNGVTVSTKTATSGQSLTISLTQAQWDAVRYGKYANATGGRNTITIEMGTEVWTYTFDKIPPVDAQITELLKSHIDSADVAIPAKKALLVASIRGKGGTVNDTDSLEVMAGAVDGIALGVNSATGTATSSTSTILTDRYDGTQDSHRYIDIMFADLGFVPKIVFVFSKNKIVTPPTTWLYDNFIDVSSSNYANVSFNANYYRLSYTKMTDRLRLPVGQSTTEYSWIAKG